MGHTLTNEQLEEFLNELQQVDNLPAEVADGIKSNNAWGYSEVKTDTGKEINIVMRDEAKKAAAERNTQKKIEKNALRKQIIDNSINDDFIDLNAPLHIAHKKLIIEQRTSKYRSSISSYSTHIEKMATDELRRLMPTDLIKVWKKYPSVIIMAPGFTWTTYDNKHSYKITPNVPFYFKPEDCQGIIIEASRNQADRIDKNICRFYEMNLVLTKLEVSLAQQLAPIKNFFELVKKNPYWYNDLVKELKNRANYVQP